MKLATILLSAALAIGTSGFLTAQDPAAASQSRRGQDPGAQSQSAQDPDTQNQNTRDRDVQDQNILEQNRQDRNAEDPGAQVNEQTPSNRQRNPELNGVPGQNSQND